MSGLRCKPGQLAMIIKSSVGNEGKVVRCLRLRPHSEFNFPTEFGPVWEVDTLLLTSHGNWVPAMYDAWLMPLNDEMVKQHDAELQKVVDKQSKLPYNTNT